MQPRSTSWGAVIRVRSLPLELWAEADRSAWAAASRPAERLKRGGAAAHMRDITRHDLARRYGYFLDYIERTEGLDCNAQAAAYVMPDRANRFRAELEARVSSVTVYGTIYKLRRMSQLLAPDRDFTWLREIEQDLALVMVPRSKSNRLVYTNVLVDEGMTLMVEADAAMHRSALGRARQFRDGLMLALLALHPFRLKNFAALEIGGTFRKVNGTWWIVLSASDTKEKRPDERLVDPTLIPWVDQYLSIHRPVLARKDNASAYLWLSSNNGSAMTYGAVERVIKQTTLATVGVDVSPHLFRTSGVSTCAVHAGDQPNLGSALMHHTDPAVAEEHYNRAKCASAAEKFADLIKTLRKRGKSRRGEGPHIDRHLVNTDKEIHKSLSVDINTQRRP
jgi:integrase